MGLSAALVYKKDIYFLIIATIGNSLGAFLNFFLGKLCSHHWKDKILKISAKQVEQFNRLFEKYGKLLALFCWLPIIGDPISFLLGSIKKDITLILIFIVIGKFSRYLLVYLLF